MPEMLMELHEERNLVLGVHVVWSVRAYDSLTRVSRSLSSRYSIFTWGGWGGLVGNNE